MVTESQNVIAIVPMKPLSQGKSRLSQSLTEEQRADLALGMLHRVILAIKAASVDTVWVVGGDDRVREMARGLGGICRLFCCASSPTEAFDFASYLFEMILL